MEKGGHGNRVANFYKLPTPTENGKLAMWGVIVKDSIEGITKAIPSPPASASAS